MKTRHSNTKQAKQTQPSESEILKMICDYLSFKQIPFDRINTQGRFVWNDGKPFLAKSRSKGFPDVVACVGAMMVLIEVKSFNGRLSDSQIECLEKYSRHGAVCVVTSTLEFLIEVLDRIPKDKTQPNKIHYSLDKFNFLSKTS